MEKRCLEIQTFSNENDLKQAYHTSVAKCVELENEIRKLHKEVDCLKKELNEKEQCGKKVYRIVPSIYTLSNNSVELNCHLEVGCDNPEVVFKKDCLDASVIFMEEVIHQCGEPMPNPFFMTPDFLESFEIQCNQLKSILSRESRLLQLQSPVYVFGDFHGNLPDLLSFSNHLWPLGLHLSPGRFLFLGDYVDRGLFSIEVVSYLFALKILYPDKIYLIRGNHELRNGRESVYGSRCFLAQLKNRYGVSTGKHLWSLANDVFDYLPYAASIDDVIFCVHGGIPRPLSLNECVLNSIMEIPCPACFDSCRTNGHLEELKRLASDLLWSDPIDEEKGAYLDESGFGKGERGDGVCYGDKAIENFLHQTGMSFVIRAHEPTQKGVSVSNKGRVISVFSTSRDHGCQDAFCGCVLIDNSQIIGINHTNPNQRGFH